MGSIIFSVFYRLITFLLRFALMVSSLLRILSLITLNSFWQMALLWAGFLTVQYFFRLSSHKKYLGALAALALGFAWFVGTFILYYQSGPAASFFVSTDAATPGLATWNIILSSASLAYLLLLMVPAYRLFKNWQYIERAR